jgi:hypothetical protein
MLRPMSRLEEFAPAYQFNEVHRIRTRAPRSRIYRSIKEVTAGEISWVQSGIAVATDPVTGRRGSLRSLAIPRQARRDFEHVMFPTCARRDTETSSPRPAAADTT